MKIERNAKSRRYRTTALAGFIVIAFAATSFGRNEQLSFSQSGSGNVIVRLSGQIFYCDGEPGAFVGLPTVSISGNTFTISSTIIVPDCPAPPPGFVPPPPTPYTIDVDLGQLADGTYHVLWGFNISNTPVPFRRFSSSFTLTDGSLPASVPALTPVMATLMLLALGAIGIVTLNR